MPWHPTVFFFRCTALAGNDVADGVSGFPPGRSKISVSLGPQPYHYTT